MNKKIFISAIVFLVCIPLFGTAAANTTEKKNISYRHEVRVGVGEMFSDIFIRAWSVDERQNIFWIPNLYADYMYHFNHWLIPRGMAASHAKEIRKMQFGIPICMVLLPLCPQYALPIFIQTRTTWHYTRHCMPAMVWELTRQDMREADLREA